MKRRELLGYGAVLAGIALVGGCAREENAATPVVDYTPEPSPTSPPLARQATPAPESSPEVVATPTPDAPPEPPQNEYGTLTDEQRTRLDAVTQTLEPVSGGETKRWAENLAYDATGTERELQAWEKIASAYTRYNEQTPGVNDAVKAEVFAVLIAASLVPAKQVPRYVKLKSLALGDAQAVAALYNAPSAML